ncbi:MFS transporter [Actinacidiphila sp. bgisy145]|uniref:MFS transporter n=1 Tax=Actinacidiphila sp. bgisy145 TaxID=3413792 RepID=UPI003EBC8594
MTRQVSRWTILVVLCASLLIVALDATVLHVAVPALTEDLRPGAQDLLWIVDVYPLIAASLLILFGTLGDRIGHRRVLLIGYTLFGTASGLAAFAPTPDVLIAARGLLGAGGAMIMPATLSILRQVFPDRRERATAIGVWSAVAAIGAAVGPVLGGFLVEHFWWGSVFLVNIPLMAVMLPVGRLLLPPSRGCAEGPWDVAGAATAALGVLGAVFGVKRFGAGAAPLEPSVWVPLLLGLALLVYFVRRQRRLAHPLIDVRMFAQAAFSTSVGCIVLAMLALVGLELIAVQYLQLVLGLSPLDTGLRLLPLTFAAMAAGLAGSRALARFGPRRMVGGGFLLTALAVLSLTAMGQQDRPLLLTVAFVALGFGLEATLFGAYESMLSQAPASRAGGAAAVGETAYQLGAGLGIALLGSVMNAVYAPHASGISATDTTAAGQSLGGAYDVAERVGGARGTALRTAARHSFVHGLHVTLLVSVALLLSGAWAARRLPRVMECAVGGGAGRSDERAAVELPWPVRTEGAGAEEKSAGARAEGATAHGAGAAAPGVAARSTAVRSGRARG